jgi:hypothetical protein
MITTRFRSAVRLSIATTVVVKNMQAMQNGSTP